MLASQRTRWRTISVAVLETPSRMSLQPRSRAQDSSQCCSTESRRPLLGSSCSDASSCDACSEIVRFANDTPLRDDAFRSFCKVHYRWPSCVSQCGRAASVSSSDAESADTVSLTISDIQEPSSTKETSHNSPASPLPAGGNAPAVWTYTHCGKCGRHYCARCSFSGHSSKSPDGSKGFAPQWTMDLRAAPQPISDSSARPPSFTDASQRMVGTPNPSRILKPSDRSSVCSQSSGTSSASTSGASTSSSEYNVPRSFLESLYDQPRSIIHTDSELFRVRPLSSRATPSPVIEMLPGIHTGGTVVCPCILRNSQQGDMRITRSSSGSSDSPLASPKRIFQSPFPIPGKGLCQTPRSACTCGLKPLILYPNYDVPRTALANLYLKEHSLSTPCDSSSEQKGKEFSEGVGEQYDVPRKFKEQLLQQEGRKASLPILCTCGNLPTAAGSFPTCNDQVMCGAARTACTCSRVTCWAGSLVSCLKRTPSEDGQIAPGGFFPHSGSPPHVAHPQCSSSDFTVCKEPRKKDDSHHADKSTQGNNAEPCCNYANCEFIESLSLYQNTCSLSSAPHSGNDKGQSKGTGEGDHLHLPLGRSESSSSPSNNVEASPDKAGTLKKATLRCSPSNTSGETYEVMSFSSAPNHLAIICDENYIAMKPLELCKCESESRCSNSSRESTDSKRTPLPLRPFMPYLLPCEEEFTEDVSSDANISWKDSHGPKCHVSKRSVNEKVPQSKHSVLSNSLGDLKRKVLTKRRSNSADGRQESEDFSETEECPTSAGMVCQARGRHVTLPKMSFHDKERAGSMLDITPPSSVPSTPNNRSMENLYRIPFHRSADCLKLKGDFSFSEEDLSKDGDAYNSHDSAPAGSNIKRSSSVPCKPQVAHQVTSPSDSGVSTSLPESSETVCELAVRDGHHVPTMHSSLPRRLTDAQGPAISMDHHPCERIGVGAGQGVRCTHTHEGFARCPQQHYILPGDRYMTGPAFKSSSGSSTSSDSDYIETLSLCSSGSNGSGSEYLRCEDMAGKACPVSCVLKPRSAKEYNAVDRTGVHQEPDEERGSALHVCHRAHHAPIHLTLPKSACSRPSPTKTTVTSKTSSPVASCHGSSTSSFPQQPEPYFQVP